MRKKSPVWFLLFVERMNSEQSALVGFPVLEDDVITHSSQSGVVFDVEKVWNVDTGVDVEVFRGKDLEELWSLEVQLRDADVEPIPIEEGRSQPPEVAFEVEEVLGGHRNHGESICVPW